MTKDKSHCPPCSNSYLSQFSSVKMTTTSLNPFVWWASPWEWKWLYIEIIFYKEDINIEIIIRRYLCRNYHPALYFKNLSIFLCTGTVYSINFTMDGMTKQILLWNLSLSSQIPCAIANLYPFTHSASIWVINLSREICLMNTIFYEMKLSVFLYGFVIMSTYNMMS